MTSKTTWVKTTKWSTSSKILNFQDGEKPPHPSILKVGSKFKCLQFTYLVVKITIVLRTRVQKWTYFEIFPNERTRPEPFYPTCRGCQRHCHQQ